jgi:hypothetical protein
MNVKSAGALALGAMLLGGCDDLDTVVGAEGGWVVSDDGRVTLEVPAGALEEDVELSIAPLSVAPAAAVGPAYEIGPRGLVLAMPATLIYDASEGMSAEARDIEIVTAGALEWAPLADREVDEDSQIYGSVLYFSAIAPVLR